MTVANDKPRGGWYDRNDILLKTFLEPRHYFWIILWFLESFTETLMIESALRLENPQLSHRPFVRKLENPTNLKHSHLALPERKMFQK